jgi:hypothetical protein
MGLARSSVAFRGVAASARLKGPLLAVGGFGLWIGFSAWARHADGSAEAALRRAWDLPAYLYLGLPLMALGVGVTAFQSPARFWRWPVYLAAGHQAGVLLLGVGMQSGLSLLILTLAVGILLGAGLCVPALLGSMAAHQWRRGRVEFGRFEPSR